MTPEELQAWAEQQKKALMDLGTDAIEAERSINWVLAHLPPGADPNTYIFSAEELYEDPASAASVADARQDWYATVDPKFARLLDAVEVEE